MIHTFHGLLEDHTNKTVEAVKAQVKETVNGSITSFRAEMNERMDKQDLVLVRLDTETSPLIKVKDGAIGSMKVLLYIAGVITVLGGAYLVLTNIF